MFLTRLYLISFVVCFSLLLATTLILYKRISNIRQENRILKQSLESAGKELERKSKTIDILNKYKIKLDLIDKQENLDIQEVKKLVPKNKARLDYDEQKKVINYLNDTIFTN